MSDSVISDRMSDLCELLDRKDGVITVRMATVRDAYGRARLRPLVCAGIHQMLEQLGIGHIPKDLPNAQDKLVRLYKKGSPVGKLIAAALRAGRSNDETLRVAAASEANLIIQKVKELVCS